MPSQVSREGELYARRLVALSVITSPIPDTTANRLSSFLGPDPMKTFTNPLSSLLSHLFNSAFLTNMEALASRVYSPFMFRWTSWSAQNKQLKKLTSFRNSIPFPAA